MQRTVRSGGKPVVPPLSARETGIKAGTGPQVRTSLGYQDGGRFGKGEIKISGVTIGEF